MDSPLESFTASTASYARTCGSRHVADYFRSSRADERAQMRIKSLDNREKAENKEEHRATCNYAHLTIRRKGDVVDPRAEAGAGPGLPGAELPPGLSVALTASTYHT